MSKSKVSKNQSTKFVSHEHLDKIGEIAVYYGFTPKHSPIISKSDIEATKIILDDKPTDDGFENGSPMRLEEKVALLRMYQEEDMQSWPQPVMLYFKDSCNAKHSGKKCDQYRYADLEILGTSGSIAEAMLVQTARIMLAEEGYKNTVVEVNSIGDKDSIAKFSRELTAYYRKKINEMTPACRQLFKEDAFKLLASTSEDCRLINSQAPKSMDFLTESSRRHLEELLDYFESLQIPYTVNNFLLANKKYGSETIIAITNPEIESGKPEHTLAMGGRYNGLAKRLGMKRDIHGVGISILAKGKNASLRKSISKVKRPIASFVQLSQESKLLSLEIIERLRKVKLPLHLSLAKDRLGAQVGIVERHHTPYIIVMGKKEAVEHTVIIRRTDTHAQVIISIDELAHYMKKAETEYWKL